MRVRSGMIVRVFMAVFMTMPVVGIGAGFGLKRRAQGAHGCTLRTQHVREHVVGLNSQPAVADLYRYVPIAKMVGRAGERQCIFAARFQQVFWCCVHDDDPPVAGFEFVSAAQQRAAFEQQGGCVAALQAHALAAFAACGEIEFQRVSRRFQTWVKLQLQHALWYQNRKYLCAIGSSAAGAQIKGSPLACTL